MLSNSTFNHSLELGYFHTYTFLIPFLSFLALFIDLTDYNRIVSCHYLFCFFLLITLSTRLISYLLSVLIYVVILNDS